MGSLRVLLVLIRLDNLVRVGDDLNLIGVLDSSGEILLECALGPSFAVLLLIPHAQFEDIPVEGGVVDPASVVFGGDVLNGGGGTSR
jgi:hypothetical protein